MARRATTATTGRATGLVISWLIVGAPLAYGVQQAVQSSLSLFGR